MIGLILTCVGIGIMIWKLSELSNDLNNDKEVKEK